MYEVVGVWVAGVVTEAAASGSAFGVGDVWLIVWPKRAWGGGVSW